MTLADEDTNSILTDKVNRMIQGKCGSVSDSTWKTTLELMQVAPPDDQILNLVAKYATKTSGAIWWPNSSLVRNKQSVAAACISDMAGVDTRNRLASRPEHTSTGYGNPAGRAGATRCAQDD